MMFQKVPENIIYRMDVDDDASIDMDMWVFLKMGKNGKCMLLLKLKEVNIAAL